MVPVLDRMPDLLICWRYQGDWYTVASSNPICKSLVHEWIMLEVHEKFPIGDRWILIPNAGEDSVIEPFTSDNWDDCVFWCAKKTQADRDRILLEKCFLK
jgi:hypothetical protein